MSNLKQLLDECNTSSMLARMTNKKLSQQIDMLDLELQDERRRVEYLTERVAELEMQLRNKSSNSD